MEPQLEMVHKSLADLPEVVLPAGFTLRHFAPGDELAWQAIIDESFQTGDKPANFDQRMKSDPEFRPGRVLFICDGEKPIATASAWHVANYGPNTGTLHMVGAISGYKGKGLGYQVCLAALHKMAGEGRTEANLKTDDFRIPAIKTYLKLGFKPSVVHENQPQRWDDVFAKIS